MKKTLLTITGIGLLSALLAYPAFSHNPGRFGGFMGHHMDYSQQMGAGQHYGPWHGNADLSEKQQQELDKLRDDFAADSKELRLNLRQKSAELQVVLASPTPDPAKARKIQKELNSLRNSMTEKRLEFNLQARKIAPEALTGNAYCAGPGSGPGWGGRHHNMMPW